ncbi:MAG: hypothetical protein ACK4M7_05860, partial [Burkholderiales bacterium]
NEMIPNLCFHLNPNLAYIDKEQSIRANRQTVLKKQSLQFNKCRINKTLILIRGVVYWLKTP